MDRGRLGGGGRASEAGARRDRRAPDPRLVHEPPHVRRCGPARGAQGRPAGGRAPAPQAMRARPASTFALPYIAVRLRLQLAKVYLALGRPDHRPSPAARDRRHLAPPARARCPRRGGHGVPQQSSRRARRRAPAATHRSPLPSSACSPTCRPTSRSARSGSGSSSPATPSAPRWVRSTGSSACPRATTQWSRRRR